MVKRKASKRALPFSPPRPTVLVHPCPSLLPDLGEIRSEQRPVIVSTSCLPPVVENSTCSQTFSLGLFSLSSDIALISTLTSAFVLLSLSVWTGVTGFLGKVFKKLFKVVTIASSAPLKFHMFIMFFKPQDSPAEWTFFLINLFLAAPGLGSCTRAFSSCGVWASHMWGAQPLGTRAQ